ncbi:MAG: 5'-nucleotidase C-terminal domain-containing protein, partial [Desulfomonile tiedjei]|nr:5'-nucleotidase C-terminal domain-containing protein [Desulfomonile tiedjei]
FVKHNGELVYLGPDVKEDPQIAAVIGGYEKEMGPELQRIIGKTEIFLDGGRYSIRSGKDTNLGRLITHLMANYAKSDAAVINGGGIRESIKEGDITMSDVFTVLPFSNIVVKMDLTGEDLQKVLQFSHDLEPGSGGKLQTFGIVYSADNGRVTIESVHGKKIDSSAVYSLATNDFLAAGGDGYTILKDRGKNCYNYAEQVSDLLIDFVKHNPVITQYLIDRLK